MVSDIWSIINKIDCIDEYDSTVYDIVVEESQAFFAGEKTAQETAKLIQSRAKLYLAE